MPTTRRSRDLAVAPSVVWETVGDVHQLPRWWPKVTRVEGADARGFTEVVATDRGRSVRMDFRILERHHGEVLRWEQLVEGTPFERFVASAQTTVRIAPSGDGGARVTLEQRQRMRGAAALGGLLVRRATRRILDEALDGLQHALR